MEDKLCWKENNKAFREYHHKLGVGKDIKSEHKKDNHKRKQLTNVNIKLKLMSVYQKIPIRNKKECHKKGGFCNKYIWKELITIIYTEKIRKKSPNRKNKKLKRFIKEDI